MELDARLPFVSLLPGAGLSVEPEYATKADAKVAVLSLLDMLWVDKPQPFAAERKRKRKKSKVSQGNSEEVGPRHISLA
jgi:hypothetical protein